MAFFKFRKAGADSASTPSQPESVEAMRKRAKHRLIGAVVLVLVAVIGFPLLFDTQPRPIAVDIPIEIPDRNKAKPLPMPAQAAATASVTQPAVTTAQAPAVSSGPVTPTAPAPAVVKETPPPAPVKVAESSAPKAESKPEAKPEPKVVAKAEPKAETRPEPKPPAKSDDGAKAKALLDGKPIETVASHAAASEGRFVVQVGAFADAGKARETRLRVEKAGLKTYTHVAETKEGKRIRVRVGPFATRGEADKAADKIKGLDLPAAILTL